MAPLSLTLALVPVLLEGVLVLSAQVDTEMVGSTVHQVAAPPPADLATAADDQGYHRTYKTKGGDGYKHFDSFHKKDGDGYGYEKHTSFGGGDGGEDGGEYHESSAYSSDDGGSSGTHGQPKVTAYHYETKSGTPRDYSNYDPETYEGDYTQVVPRRAPRPGGPYQPRYTSGQNPPQRTNKPAKPIGKEPQVAGTEDDAEYDYYYEGEGDGEGDGGEGEGEGDGGEGGSAEAGYSYYSDSGEGDYEGEAADYY